MLSIGKLVAGAEQYYLSTVASGLEEYYTGAGEAPGHWLGSAAAELGLSGEVGADALAAVLRGVSPLDGSSLTGRSVLPEKRVAGFDVTLSAPKSVSLLYALGPDAVGEAVRRAHDEAVSDAIFYLEAHVATARRGAGGKSSIGTSGLLAAGFRHRTSRAGDPQLHTHVLVANLVRGDDGRWSSLHAALLYHHGRTAGFVYQAALRAVLVTRLGVRFGPVSQGAAELVGVPKRLLTEFSQRRAEIVGRLDEVGTHSRRAAEIAALDTRQSKQPAQGGNATIAELHDQWRARARAAGVAPELLESLLGRRRERGVPEQSAGTITESLVGPDGLTRNTSTFQRRDIVRGVAEGLVDGARVVEIEALTDMVMRDQHVVHLGVNGRGGEGLFTTAELLRIEASLIKKATGSLASGRGIADAALTETVLAERPTISGEQAEMVRRLNSSGNGVDIVVGKAGAGKTFALDAARAAWQRAGFTVRGAALAARAAAELEAGAGISSTTIAGLRGALVREETTLGPSDIVVIDEAGMVGTRDLYFLVERVVDAGGKIVTVGDPRQLPEIEAGGGLASMVARIGAIELRENRRQSEGWERAALDELRAGDIGAALVAYGEHERVHLVKSAGAARVSMVKEWAAAREENVTGRMYALRRADVEELNSLARVELRRRGELGDDVLSIGDKTFAGGDEVLFLRNYRALGVLNGTRGVVRAAFEGGLVVDTERGALEVPYSYLEEGHLGHGYASTVHKAQGATVGRAFVLGGEAMYREAGYVAMSRAAAGTDLYVVSSAFERGPGSGSLGEDPLTLFGEALRASRAKRLAIESFEPESKLAELERPRPEPESDVLAELGCSQGAMADRHRLSSVLTRDAGTDRRHPDQPGPEQADGRAVHAYYDDVGPEPLGLLGRKRRLAELLRGASTASRTNRADVIARVVNENAPPLSEAALPPPADLSNERSETAAILEILGAFGPVPEREHGHDLGRSR